MKINFASTMIACLTFVSLIGLAGCGQPDAEIDISPKPNTVEVDTAIVDLEKDKVDVPAEISAKDAFAQGMKIYKDGDQKKAKQYFDHAANAGLKSANVYLGLIHSIDSDLEDQRLAAQNFRTALEDAPRLTPLVMLARAHKDGKGVPQDDASALQYYYRVKLSVKDRSLPAFEEASDYIDLASDATIEEALRREKSIVTEASVLSSTSLENVISQSHLQNSVYIAPGTY